jgi:hypothetical protein
MTDFLRPREPAWLELAGGVALQVRPLTTPVMLAARGELRAAGAGLDARIELLIKALARAAILDWRGVPGGEAETAPVTPEAIDALFDHWPIFEAFQTRYFDPAMALDGEKND